MSKFEFESHESTPEDQYIKEIVTFKFTYDSDSFYVPYFRKQAKDGGLFWSVASVGITQNGGKKYMEAFTLDSRMKEKQIKEFLERRSWEQKAQPVQQQQGIQYPHGLVQNRSPMPEMPPLRSMDEVQSEAELPF